MPTLDEYKKDGGWYEFPDGTKKHGKAKAEEYFDTLDVTELFEEEEVEEEVVEEKDEATFLVRMTIPRVRFEQKGPSGKRYTFTKEHPLVVVTGEADTDFFVKKEGFEIASPEMAREFYS